MHAGLRVRLTDIPIEDGTITDSHGFEKGEFARQLKTACGQYFGTAGPTFLGQLLNHYPTLPALEAAVQSRMRDATEHLRFASMQGRLDVVVKCFLHFCQLTQLCSTEQALYLCCSFQ